MAQIRVAATAVLDAPPRAVYALLADYRDGHPHILPARVFTGYEVEQGGVGAGTRIRFGMRAFGQLRLIHATISEPEPGRVLAETDVDTGAVTTFTVDPVDEGLRARVTIETFWKKPGVVGFFDRLLAPPFLRHVYEEELRLLGQRLATSEAHPA